MDRYLPKRFSLVVAFFGTLSMMGCQSILLENHTMRQARTLTDIQYRQVLDNLAMFSVNPGSLPFFSAAGTGQTNISQSATSNFTPSVDLLLNPAKTVYKYYSDKYGYGVTGTETNLEQWTTSSVLNPDELQLMQCIYQQVLGFEPPNPSTCLARMNAFFKNNPELADALHRKWLCIGWNGEKPPKGAISGHNGKRYVWVMPENTIYLTRITFAILDVATALPPSSTTNKIQDPNASAKNLQDRLTALTGAYDKVKDKSNFDTAPLIKDINDTIIKLNVAINPTPTATKFDSLEIGLRNKLNNIELTERPNASISMNSNELKNLIAELKRAPAVIEREIPSSISEGDNFFRPRKNLYNTNAVPLGISIP